MFLPPRSTPFICSRASCAASGKSYSTNANPCNIIRHKKAVSKDGYKRNDIALKISDPELGAAGTVFSLNFSSAGKGPFMASKAKNMCHRPDTFLGEAGESGERDMDPSSLGHLGAKF